MNTKDPFAYAKKPTVLKSPFGVAQVQEPSSGWQDGTGDEFNFVGDDPS